MKSYCLFLNLNHSRGRIPAEYNTNHNISYLLFIYLTKIDNRNQKLKPKMYAIHLKLLTNFSERPIFLEEKWPTSANVWESWPLYV